MPYSIQFTSRARRDLEGLDRAAQLRQRTHIDRLAANPIPAGAKKLHGGEPYYRIRVGDYRVVYQVYGKQLVVVVRSEEHTSELQSLAYLVCRLLLEKKKKDIARISSLLPAEISR